MMMTYRDEFPDFDYELPVIAGFKDHSWHNEVCPSLVTADRKQNLWCDYADPAKREMEGGKRFTLVAGEYGEDEQTTLCESDELADILAAIERARADVR